ncbi:type III secretion system export apparatus subunit SctU [Motilimonas pumila]|uniref:EscU/YscU/HrcU family type III secretion system export apparatus switch protein n=1 Tax=Motilimonas pumila TaxID=2303987 RepID=A0A418YE25_9GAMM|nr:type III secretion system export apparatus subunit SctU [Motilimonas pumila]RJG42795.1 EscU/YscU/HrcU family type III secretion system export apparatus switch protein [Motilimonas pumila]
MSEKTEKPTQKKLRDAKAKGQVAKSKEIVSLATLLAVFAYFWLFGHDMLKDVAALFDISTLYYERGFAEAAKEIMMVFVIAMMEMLLPLLLLVFVVAIVANLAQSGLIFSAESIKPELKKINPAEGVKKIFSIKNLLEFVKSVIKIAMLGYTAYFIIEKELNNLMFIPYCGAGCALSMSASMVMTMILYCLGVFVFLAAADYLMEKHQHIKQLKMSMDEIKREYKETEGSPEIKGKRKQIHQEMMNEEIETNVKNADVVVTNPTRIAVAIRYDGTEAPLPWVTAKGEFMMAQKIRKLAEKHNVPIVRRKYLARGMFATLEPGEFITSEFIEPVAEVLKWLRDVNEQYDDLYDD